MKKETKILLSMVAALLSLYLVLPTALAWLVPASAVYMFIEAHFGERYRAWWKGVEFRAKVNQKYSERAKTYENRLKAQDGWKH